MFALIVIIFTGLLVIFGIVGWHYFDYYQNNKDIQDYFKDNFDKL